jgi:hypothetical protein
MELQARRLSIELRQLLVAERQFHDATTPEPNVHAKQLVELISELGMKLSAAPPELKRQRVPERLDCGSENSGGRRGCLSSGDAPFEDQNAGPVFGEPIGDAATHQAATNYDHVGVHCRKVLGPRVAASA